MAAITLEDTPQLPSTLKTVEYDPASLYRISGHDTGEPFFGRWATNRFDDPNPDPNGRYGTCYLGTSFDVAIAETLLHDRKPIKGHFYVEPDVIKSRYVIQFQGTPLILANLTGAELKRMGGQAELSGTPSYKMTQRWSVAIHNHLNNVDGFIYMSRHLNDKKAIVLFDRAACKLRMISAIPLHTHPDFGQVATDLYIQAKRP
jgi:hypothetical protein